MEILDSLRTEPQWIAVRSWRGHRKLHGIIKRHKFVQVVLHIIKLIWLRGLPVSWGLGSRAKLHPVGEAGLLPLVAPWSSGVIKKLPSADARPSADGQGHPRNVTLTFLMLNLSTDWTPATVITLELSYWWGGRALLRMLLPVNDTIYILPRTV